MTMRVTALMENTPAEGSTHMRAELGLSLHIEHAGKRILFDTGASGAFAENAGRLGVDLAAVDAAVISHHHYDHGGGLRRFLEMNARAQVYLRSRPAGECHFRFMGLDKYIGLDQALLREQARRFVFVTRRTEFSPGATVLTEVGRPYPLPRGNRYIFLESGGRRAPDDFRHELVLVLQGDGGLVVFTGCSHQGILNMVEAVTRAFPGMPIRAVFGGFHLVILPMFNFMAGSRKEVAEIGTEMLKYRVGRVYTGHCTGSRAFVVLKSVMGEKLERFAAGTTVEV